MKNLAKIVAGGMLVIMFAAANAWAVDATTEASPAPTKGKAHKHHSHKHQPKKS